MRYLKHSCRLFVLLILLSSEIAFSKGSSLPEEEQIKIILPQSSVINNDQYLLGEISQIEGGDAVLLEKVSQIVIGQSPLPGRKLTVTRSLILSRLRSQKINTKRFLFPGSESSSITRAALKIKGKDIEQVVLKHIRDTNNNEDLKPRILAKTRDIFLPRGQVSYVINSKGKYKKEGGYRNYDIEFSIDGKAVRIVTVRTYLKLLHVILLNVIKLLKNRI